MSGTGIVAVVFGADEPDNDRSARKVIVDLADGSRIAFMIPIGEDPPIGATISWGPHHAWWPGHKVTKLTWAADPDARFSPP